MDVALDSTAATAATSQLRSLPKPASFISVFVSVFSSSRCLCLLPPLLLLLLILHLLNCAGAFARRLCRLGTPAGPKTVDLWLLPADPAGAATSGGQGYADEIVVLLLVQLGFILSHVRQRKYGLPRCTLRLLQLDGSPPRQLELEQTLADARVPAVVINKTTNKPPAAPAAALT